MEERSRGSVRGLIFVAGLVVFAGVLMAPPRGRRVELRVTRQPADAPDQLSDAILASVALPQGVSASMWLRSERGESLAFIVPETLVDEDAEVILQVYAALYQRIADSVIRDLVEADPSLRASLEAERVGLRLILRAREVGRPKSFLSARLPLSLRALDLPADLAHWGRAPSVRLPDRDRRARPGTDLVIGTFVGEGGAPRVELFFRTAWRAAADGGER